MLIIKALLSKFYYQSFITKVLIIKAFVYNSQTVFSGCKFIKSRSFSKTASDSGKSLFSSHGSNWTMRGFSVRMFRFSCAIPLFSLVVRKRRWLGGGGVSLRVQWQDSSCSLLPPHRSRWTKLRGNHHYVYSDPTLSHNPPHLCFLPHDGGLLDR